MGRGWLRLSLALHTPYHVQDPILAEQILSDNLHNVDLAIVELLQLMDLDQGNCRVLACLISLHPSLTVHGKVHFYITACSSHVVCWDLHVANY